MSGLRNGTARIVKWPPRGVTGCNHMFSIAALLQFSVIVEREAHGAIHFTFRDSTGAPFGDVRRPEIVAGKDSWHFADHIQAASPPASRASTSARMPSARALIPLSIPVSM